jgi:hypothetical protein
MIFHRPFFVCRAMRELIARREPGTAQITDMHAASPPAARQSAFRRRCRTIRDLCHLGCHRSGNAAFTYCLSECALSCSCKFAVLPAASCSGLSTVLAVVLARTVEASMSPRVTSASARPSFLGNPRKTLHAYGFTRRTIHRLNRQPQCQRARSRPEGTSAPDTQSLVFALMLREIPGTDSEHKVIMHTFYVLTNRVLEYIRAHFHDSESFSSRLAVSTGVGSVDRLRCPSLRTEPADFRHSTPAGHFGTPIRWG